jgi:hypothetical protein
MTSSWNNLPIEVLEIIFNVYKVVKYWQPRTLFQCQLVCRNWRLPAQRLTYSSIDFLDLCNKKLDYTATDYYPTHGRTLWRWLKTLDSPDATRWNYVKTLDFSAYWENFYFPNEVTFLDRCVQVFPYIEHLKAHEVEGTFL